MSIGLDLGSTQFRSLRYQGGRLVGRSCRAESVGVPDSPAHRRLLERDQIPFAECQGSLHILGDPAREWSRLLSLPARRLLPDGQLPQDDGLARQSLSLMLDAVLPAAQTRNERCSVTIPGELLPTLDSPEREFFLRLVRLRGYEPDVIGQGQALALAEMGSAGYSGLSVVIGATLCEFSLISSGRELARCALPWGFDELESALETAAFEPQLRESDREPAVRQPEWTLKFQRQVCDFLVEILLEAGQRIEQNRGFQVLRQPAAVVVCGGCSTQPIFSQLFEQAWQRSAWPMKAKSFAYSAEREFTIARGCLIHSVLETQQEPLQAAA